MGTRHRFGDLLLYFIDFVYFPVYRCTLYDVMGCAVWLVDRRFFAWFAVAVFYALQYILRVMPNTLSGEIMGRFDIGVLSFGQFSALYYAGYTVAHIPVGVLIDRFGPKRVVPVCMLLTSLGVVPMLFGSWMLVQIGRVLVGVGSAAAAMSILKVSKMYFGGKFVRMASIALVIGILGAMYGGMPFLSLIESFGWHRVLLVLIVGGCTLSLLAACLLFDVEDTTGDGSSAYGQARGSIYQQIKGVIFNKHLVIISLLGGCMAGPLEGFAGVWATTFLSEVCRLSHKAATILPSTMFVGSCIGTLIFGRMLEKSYNGWDIVICCGIFTIAAFAVMLMGHCGSGVSAFVLLMVLGVCSAYGAITAFKAIECVDSDSTALAAATANMIVMSFGYFFNTAISLVINWGSKVVPGHAAVYGSDLLVKAMLVIPLGTLVGTVGTMLMKRYSKRQESTPQHG